MAESYEIMKWRDEIVDEVRATREAYAAQFDFDIRKIAEDLKKKEAEHPQDLAPCGQLRQRSKS